MSVLMDSNISVSGVMTRVQCPPCDCCPYGYHIDLDFVRYCEALSQGAGDGAEGGGGGALSASRLRRRERRRQRHSVEVLLGLTSPSFWNIEQQLPQIPQEETPNPTFTDDELRDALSTAVQVFEDTLQRTHRPAIPTQECTSFSFKEGVQEMQTDQATYNLVNSSDCITTTLTTNAQQDFDVVSVGSAASGISTGTLQNIREQMALSLERMRELEEQVKLIPILQVQLSVLKEEKRKLLLQQTMKCSSAHSKGVKNAEVQTVCNASDQQKTPSCSLCSAAKYRKDPVDPLLLDRFADYSTSFRERSHSLSENVLGTARSLSQLKIPNRDGKPFPMTVRDKGVACCVVTREVGISHQQPKTRSTATSTTDIQLQLGFSEVWSENIFPDNTLEFSSHHFNTEQSTILTSENKQQECQYTHKLLNCVAAPRENLRVTTELNTSSLFPEDDVNGNVKTTSYLDKVDLALAHTKTILHIDKSDIGIQVDDFLRDQQKLCVGHSDVAIQHTPCVQDINTDIQFKLPIEQKDAPALQTPRDTHSVSVQSDSSSWLITTAVQCKTFSTVDKNIQCNSEFWQKCATTQCERAVWFKNFAAQATRPGIEIGILVKPPSADACIGVAQQTRERGSSDCTVSDILCTTCNVKKRSIGVSVTTTDLPGDHLCTTTTNTPPTNCISVGCQTLSVTTIEKTTNTTAVTASCTCQSFDQHCSDTQHLLDGNVNMGKTNTIVSAMDTPASPPQSRIPRRLVSSLPKHHPTDVVAAGGNDPECPAIARLAALRDNSFVSSPNPVKLACLQPPTPKWPHQEPSMDLTDHRGDADANSLGRAEPSKEMKAAMKVINDYLTKYPSHSHTDLPHHLSNAANIVQQEWFKISGGKTVNPVAVEDYLDYIEGCGLALLEFVVNMTDMSGNTALHYAVSSGNFDVVSILLDSKVCDVNKRNAAGYTCVMLATLVKLRSETHRQIIRRMFLLADVNMKAKPHGQTALMLATSHGSLHMVEMLTEAGADMNIQDADGSTALMCAADHGFVDIVKHIISQPDCDVTITDSDGCSALDIAMESGNRHIGLLLYAHVHFTHGTSPNATRHRHSRSSTPTLRCPTVCEQPDKLL